MINLDGGRRGGDGKEVREQFCHHHRGVLLASVLVRTWRRWQTAGPWPPAPPQPSAGLRAGASVTEWGSQHAAWSWGWGEQVVGGPGWVAPSALALGGAGQALTAERQPLSSRMMALKPRKPVTMTRAPAKMRM